MSQPALTLFNLLLVYGDHPHTWGHTHTQEVVLQWLYLDYIKNVLEVCLCVF